MEHSRTIFFFLATLCVATNAAMYKLNATHGLAAMFDTDNGCLKVMRYVKGDEETKNSSSSGQKMDYTTDPVELCLKYVHQVNNHTDGEKKECKDIKYEEKEKCGVVTCKSHDKMMEMRVCAKETPSNMSFFLVTTTAKNYYWCDKTNSSHCMTPSELRITFEIKLMNDLKIEKMNGDKSVTFGGQTKQATAYKVGMGNETLYVFKKYEESNETSSHGDLKSDMKMEKDYEGYLTLKMAHFFPENVTTISAHLGIDPGHMKAKARKTTNGSGLLIGSVVNVVLAFVLSFLVL